MCTEELLLCMIVALATGCPSAGHQQLSRPQPPPHDCYGGRCCCCCRCCCCRCLQRIRLHHACHRPWQPLRSRQLRANSTRTAASQSHLQPPVFVSAALSAPHILRNLLSRRQSDDEPMSRWNMREDGICAFPHRVDTNRCTRTIVRNRLVLNSKCRKPSARSHTQTHTHTHTHKHRYIEWT